MLRDTLHDAGAAFQLDCHRRLRGPYTGTGTLLRQLVPEVYRHSPDLIKKHTIEILSIAPELRSLLSVSQETLTSLAIPRERTRFYSRLRTLRLAHGLYDFLHTCLAIGVYTELTLFFDNVQEADALDQEFIRVLLRRASPDTLHVIVGTTSDSLPPALTEALARTTVRLLAEPFSAEEGRRRLQAWGVPPRWQDWLLQYSQGWYGEWEPLGALKAELDACVPQGSSFTAGMQALHTQAAPEQRALRARAFLDADGTGENLLETLAYQTLETETRQQCHDARAEALEQEEQWSLHLGAIPYHREHGQDPAHTGAKALRDALDYCLDMGYYETTIDFGHRGRAVIKREEQLEYYWVFTTKITTSLAALERGKEAEQFYNEARAATSDPIVHMQAAYATAMLHTRHFPEGQRNHLLAKGRVNEAIGIASLLPDPKERAFHMVFNQNGLALIEVHLKRFPEALSLVTEGLDRLNRVLEPNEHLLHRSVLLYNRAQVYATLGQYELALADYTAVISQDPYYSEYYFDRGNVYRRQERNAEALADYERAISYSPPYPEAYYNRAGVLSALGREQEALADYTYVLELDPDYLDALLNRASILYEQGDYEAARRDVEHGLRLDEHNASLRCTLGLLEMAQEHSTEAYHAFSRALELDSSLAAAWINRAILVFETGETEKAIADLTCALALGENATVRYNRGIAYQAREQWNEAIEDFTMALTLDEEDAQDLLYRRSVCSLHVGKRDLAQQDLQRHLAFGPSPYMEEIQQQMAGYRLSIP
jgi:tetratricopeptide (TPR) repeat protein